jgi:tRNA A-37 threonylcarbamoyl transferase component Bud32
LWLKQIDEKGEDKVMIDISNKKDFEEYLLNKKLINHGDGYEILYLTGGVSGTTALVTSGEEEMIVKQALAKLKVAEEWLCDPARMEIEMKSNAVYHRLVPENVPAVISYDEENYIFVREAAPEYCRMWKTDLMAGKLDFHIAKRVIDTLAIVHNACAIDEEVVKDFADNQIFYELRISPYIEFICEKHPSLVEYATPIIKELMESKITLVHGDYSPKNVVVFDETVYVTDYEVAHYGHPSFDLGFLCNHLILKSIHMKEFGDGFLGMLRYVLSSYFEKCNYMDKESLEESFLKLLPLLMIARVDGKSPVEYIVDPKMKEFVRTLAFGLIDNRINRIEDLINYLYNGIIMSLPKNY